MKRDVYRKLMSLQSPSANNLLGDKFNSIAETIKEASNNDTIFEQLNLLSQFVLQVPGEAVELLRELLDNEPMPPVVRNTKFGKIVGKSNSDLNSKTIQLLNQIRYYETTKVVAIYHKLFQRKDDSLSRQLEDKIRETAEYNLEALSHIGYRTQLDIIKYLDTLDLSHNGNLDFFIKLTSHLVSSEGESHSMKDENTFVWGFAPLPVNDELVEIREWILTKLGLLLKSNNASLSTKNRIIDLMKTLTHIPSRGEASPELIGLIQNNTKKVLDIYSDSLLGEGDFVCDPVLGLEIEEQLYFMGKDHEDEDILLKMDSISKGLSSDRNYQIYSMLLGDKLRHISKKPYEQIQKESSLERASLIEEIQDTSDNGAQIIKQIASHSTEIESWKLSSYYSLLIELAEAKPGLAMELIIEAAQDGSELLKMAGKFLIGFKKADAIKEYNGVLEIIVKHKVGEALISIPQAISLGSVEKDEMLVVSEMIHKSGRFEFIDKEAWPSYISGLVEVLGKRLTVDPNDNEAIKLFIDLLNMYESHSSLYFHAIDIAEHRDEIHVEKLSKEIRQTLEEKLINTPRLSHEHERIITKLASGKSRWLIEFFSRRIKLRDSTRLKNEDYDPVPYHIGDGPREICENDPEFGEVFIDVIKSFSTQWTMYNSEMSQLLKQLTVHRQYLNSFVKKADQDGLLKVANFYSSSFESIDLETAFAIIARTKNKKIWSKVSASIFTTGVVSGEYGVADAHQAKYDHIKANFSNSKNKNIREFARLELDSLDKAIIAERQRVEEELRLRKIDFEH